MSDERSDVAAVPVDQWPDPVCGYAVADGTPVVRDANAAFRQQLGDVTVGRPVTEALSALGVDLTGAETADLATALPGEADGDRSPTTVELTAEVGGTQYLVRAVSAGTDASGHLVFLDAGDWPGASTAADRTRGGLDPEHVASVVSHDLRNPLDVARARLRAGRDQADNEHFERVARAHDRMERIIEDVLTLARDATAVDLDEAVDLETVATAAWETVETGDATLAVRDPLPTADADPDSVSRLFENLFRNAVEHGAQPGAAGERSAGDESAGDGDDGSVTVTIGRLPAGGPAGFFVEDDGPGIPPEARDQVFEPGYSTDTHGTGLGLAIAARIADSHGWSIALESAGTGGARFEVRGLDGQ